MLRPPLTPEQWAQARHLRDGGATFAAIAREIGAHEFHHRQPRPPARLAQACWLPARRSARHGAFHRTESIADIRRSVLTRYYRVMNLNLELMELHMKKQVKDAKKRGADLASIDPDKHMRPMTAVTKSLSQAKELDSDLDRAAGGGPTSSNPDSAASEEEAFRREIAERLEKLSRLPDGAERIAAAIDRKAVGPHRLRLAADFAQ